MVIAYLVYDMRSLRTCTLTCCSWYIAAVPHLHHDLLIDPNFPGRNLRWPNPLQYMHKLGLLPFVKTFWVHRSNRSDAFSSKCFNNCTLRQFSALTNVNRLMINNLDIPSFMPRIRRYFGHFLPTVRELSLKEPKGSRRQIIFFVGLFKHLEDIEFHYDATGFHEESVDDPTLIPSFAPPLRGSLRMVNFTRVDLLKDMIGLFGGIRFYWIDLFNVKGMRPLLDACAETLECLRFSPIDPRGKEFYLNGVQVLADSFTVKFSLQDFDLSRNKSLRALEIMAYDLDKALQSGWSGATSNILEHALTVVASPAPFRITVIYREDDFRGVERWHSDWPYLREMSQADIIAEASRHHRRFEVLRKAHKVRDFQLVLCADVWDPVGEYAVRMLKEAVAEERAKGGFNVFLSEPLVIYRPWRSRL